MIQSKRNIITAWFDGAAQLDGQICGAGGVFKTPDLMFINGFLIVGEAQIQS
jgi:hypothetical protein